jgi:hypothetical protein
VPLPPPSGDKTLGAKRRSQTANPYGSTIKCTMTWAINANQHF